jgi:hypothetical protein
MLKES